jgi:putative transcriptional regulator
MYTLHLMKNLLREIRLSKDISQVGLAETIGVSRQTIHAIETGKYVPSVELALLIAQTFKIKVEEIFILDRNKK